MTVMEVVKTYGLAGFSKHYKNVYGNNIDTKYPITELAKMNVKDLYINLMQETATITVLPQESEEN